MTYTLSTRNSLCPCCGFGGLKQPAYERLCRLPVSDELMPPYFQHFGEPSYEVCACCGFEFGFDDEPGTNSPVSFREHLEKWIICGAKWFDPTLRPQDWDLAKQLTEAGIKIEK